MGSGKISFWLLRTHHSKHYKKIGGKNIKLIFLEVKEILPKQKITYIHVIIVAEATKEKVVAHFKNMQ